MDFTPTQKCVAHFEVLGNRVNTSAPACIKAGIHYNSSFITISEMCGNELKLKGAHDIFTRVI